MFKFYRGKRSTIYMIHVIMKKMYPSVYHHNGFVGTHALGYIYIYIYIYVFCICTDSWIDRQMKVLVLFYCWCLFGVYLYQETKDNFWREVCLLCCLSLLNLTCLIFKWSFSKSNISIFFQVHFLLKSDCLLVWLI